MPSRRWSQHVTETSNALDLDAGVFARKDPGSIARSLKRSAERSRQRKTDAFRSAMSMLTFYINRAGTTLPASQRRRLQAAKDELRRLFKRAPAGRRRSDPPSSRTGGRSGAGASRPPAQGARGAKKNVKRSTKGSKRSTKSASRSTRRSRRGT
jgi:hypothetical protein